MRIYTMWCSVLAGPPLTPEEARQMRGRSSGGEQYGNIVQGRVMLRSITHDPQSLIDYLNEIYKGPVRVMDVRDQGGIRFGFVRQMVEGDPGENPVYEIVPATYIDDDGNEQTVVPFPVDDAEHDKFMVPVSSEDIDGNPIMKPPAENSGAGWADWNGRVDG